MRIHRRGGWEETKRELKGLAWAVLLIDAIAISLGLLATRASGENYVMLGILMAAVTTIVFALLVGGNLLVEAIAARWIDRRP